MSDLDFERKHAEDLQRLRGFRLLDDDFMKAMRMMEQIEEITARLPGLDCGSCGSPSCRALAEDIVRGFAEEGDCIFKMRERVSDLAKKVVELESHLPPPFRVDKEDN